MTGVELFFDSETAADPVRAVSIGLHRVVNLMLIGYSAVSVAAIALLRNLLMEDPLMRVAVALDLRAAATRNAALTLV